MTPRDPNNWLQKGGSGSLSDYSPAGLLSTYCLLGVCIAYNTLLGPRAWPHPLTVNRNMFFKESVELRFLVKGGS